MPSYDVIRTACTLTQLDNDMRGGQSVPGAVAARFRFYREAVRAYALRRLNSLGALVPGSRLGECSLNLVFDDFRYADAVVRRLVDLADRDPAFKGALVEQEGAAFLAHLRAKAAGPAPNRTRQREQRPRRAA